MRGSREQGKKQVGHSVTFAVPCFNGHFLLNGRFVGEKVEVHLFPFSQLLPYAALITCETYLTNTLLFLEY